MTAECTTDFYSKVHSQSCNIKLRELLFSLISCTLYVNISRYGQCDRRESATANYRQ